MRKVTKKLLDASFELADAEKSKLGEREKDLFGLSSHRLRCLINNLCHQKNTKYLEIGVYRGTTLISALYGNPTVKALGVESFTYDEREPKKHAPEGEIWPNMKSHLDANLKRYEAYPEQVNLDNIEICEGFFENLTEENGKDFDVCFFDVTPIKEHTYDTFFETVIPLMAKESLLVFSNYSNEKHAQALDEAIIKHKDKIIVSGKVNRVSSSLSDDTQYYSGILAVLITKKEVK